MATILARRQADGTTRYTAIVRIRQGKLLIHRECKTFGLRSHAEKWAKHREVALDDPASTLRQNNQPRTLASLIRWYIDTFEQLSKWQRSKQTHLEFLERHAIGKANALALTSAQLIKHIQARRAEGAGPATAVNDLIWIGVVLRAAKSVEGINIATGPRSNVLKIRPLMTFSDANADQLIEELGRVLSEGIGRPTVTRI